MSTTLTLVPAEQLAATNQAHFPNESADYRKARNALLVAEIELRRQLERVAKQRRALPQGGEIPQDFALTGESAPTQLSSLFGDHDTLLVYSMMFGPQRKAPCPMCTFVPQFVEWHRCQPPPACCSRCHRPFAPRAPRRIQEAAQLRKPSVFL